MIAYLIKSGLCLFVLWDFYKIALEQQSAHIFKRFYLLASLVIALVLPLITISYAVPAVVQSIETLTYTTPIITQPSTVVAETTNWLAVALWVIYTLGLLIFGFRFLRNIGQIRSKISQNIHVSTQKSVHILVESNIVPHTFLNYIFLPRAEYETNRIPKEILLHEQAHVTQKHTLDILFIEFLQVIFWFNPLLHFVKKSIALNHEFLADQKAIDRQENPENYINLLVYHAQGLHHAPMTSALNYSLTRPPYRRAKKRILMISQSFSAKKLATRLAFLVPILAICVYFFNQEIVAKPVIQEQEKISTKAQFEGKWKSNSQDIIFDIQDQNGGIVWDVIENGELPVRYYPKPTEDGFYFTQGNEDIYYTINGSIMQDSKGNMYKKYENAAKKLTIYVSDEKISINDKPATSTNFTKVIDKITTNWTKEEMMNYSIHLRSKNGVDKFVGKLASAFHNTRLYKTNPSKELIPPPPPPAPELPKVGKVAPPPAPAEKETKTLYLNIRGNQVLLNDKEIKVADFAKSLNNITKDWNPTELKNARVWIKMENPDNNIMEQLEEEYKKTRLYKAQPNHGLIPTPPPAPTPPELSTIAPPMPPTPPLPPTPPSPEKMIEEMTAARATFYYNGDKITAEKAKELFKTEDNLSFMATEAKNGGKPMVLITDN